MNIVPVVDDEGLRNAVVELGRQGIVSTIGWEIPPDADVDAVLGAAPFLYRMRVASDTLYGMTHWCIGDWLNWMGAHDTEDRYIIAAEQLGYNYPRLRVLSWVARTFPIAERKPELTFSHHEILASSRYTGVRKAVLASAVATSKDNGKMVSVRRLTIIRNEHCAQNPALVVAGIYAADGSVTPNDVLRQVMFPADAHPVRGAVRYQEPEVPPFQQQWRKRIGGLLANVLGYPFTQATYQSYNEVADAFLRWIATDDARSLITDPVDYGDSDVAFYVPDGAADEAGGGELPDVAATYRLFTGDKGGSALPQGGEQDPL